jgi:hypothetical protein
MLGGMIPPSPLPLDLALTLHPGHSPAVQDQHAEWAARLGYAEVWLPVGGPAEIPAPSRLVDLAGIGPRLGLVVLGDDAAVLALPGEPLLEVSGTALIAPAAVWSRVRRHRFDPAAAGTVVTGPTRADVVTGVVDTVASRRAAGVAGHPVFAALPVAIGRTRNEAVARAARDRRFAGAERAALFGTYEQAQGQVLDLAAAGVDGLRLTVADEVDVADLLAQIRAVVVAATPALPDRRR